jgi:uncharacterized glyoxalase superfamily protein PhnB
MIGNRSVPTDVILPHVVCRSVADAAAWLSATFGFTEHYRYGDPNAPDGAQMHLGKAYIMLHSLRPGRTTPADAGNYTQSLTIFVDDVDAHYEHTKAAGARIVEELHETIYGERQYGVEDPDGHLWLFSRHAHDISPAEWGAVIAEQ